MNDAGRIDAIIREAFQSLADTHPAAFMKVVDSLKAAGQSLADVPRVEAAFRAAADEIDARIRQPPRLCILWRSYWWRHGAGFQQKTKKPKYERVSLFQISSVLLADQRGRQEAAGRFSLNGPRR
jgi:hypothetical protein